MFDMNLKNIEIITVLNLSWSAVDKAALPRSFHALSLRIKGDALFLTKNQSLSAGTNDIVFVPKGVGYHLRAKEEHLICIHFLADDIQSDQIEKLSTQNDPIYKELFGKMYLQWLQKKPGYFAGTMSYFYKIVSKIQIRQASKILTNLDTMLQMKEYIHEHFTESDLSIPKLAAISGLSESYFRKIFTQYFHATPLRYINDLRVDYAIELLKSNYYRMNEIADLVGFHDPKYLGTVIKKRNK